MDDILQWLSVLTFTGAFAKDPALAREAASASSSLRRA